MRIKKPHPFEPGREYNPGERAVYRGMVIIAERWVKPSDKLIEKVGKFVCLSRCACCVIHKDDCLAVGLKCYRTSRSDNKVIYFRKLYNITDVDNACIDSDYLLEVIQLVINRTDETEESKTAMLEYIKKLPQIEHIEV